MFVQKSRYLTFVILSIVVLVDARKRVRINRMCHTGNRYPHESNCNKFYACRQGVKVVLTCPYPLYYSTALKVCDIMTREIAIRCFPTQQNLHKFLANTTKPPTPTTRRTIRQKDTTTSTRRTSTMVRSTIPPEPTSDWDMYEVLS